MNIDLLNEYIEFAKSLNVSRAAKRLFMSQSTLSKHLKTIEDEVGVKLIDRSDSSHLRLTKAGSLFLDACSSICHTYDTALERCHELTKDPKKVSVLLPCTIDASRELIFEIFHNMQQDHQDISMNLLHMAGYSMLDNLIMGRVDCATSHAVSQKQQEELEALGVTLMPLLEDDVFLWADRDSPLMAKEHLFVKDLADIPILVPASRAYMDLQGWYQALCEQAGFKPLLVYKDVTDMYELMNTSFDDAVMVLTSEVVMGDPVFRTQKHLMVRKFEDEGLKNTLFLAYLSKNRNPALGILMQNIRRHTYSFLEDKDVNDIICR